MSETLDLVIHRLCYFLAVVIVIAAMIFFASLMPITGIFTLLAGLVILPLAEPVMDMKLDNRFLLMAVLLVIGAIFMPPLYDTPFVN